MSLKDVGQRKEYGKKNHTKNREKRLAGMKAYRLKNAASLKATRRERMTGVSESMYDFLFSMQDGKCAVCSTLLANDKFTHADHCHDTQQPRGLLCHRCNTAEGLIRKVGLTPQGFADRLQQYLDNPPAAIFKLI